MKKKLMLLLFSVLAIHASAQFKIHSNGYMSFNTTATPLSPISINCSGSSSYFAQYAGEKCGLYIETTSGNNAGIFNLKPTNTMNFALRATITPPSNNAGNYSIGVWGLSGYSPINYGVAGTIITGTGTYGVGVFGADNPLSFSTLTQNYAGFFDGDVKITDNLQVNGTVQGVLLGNSASATSSVRGIVQEDKASTLATAEMFSHLDLTTFTYSPEARKTENKIDRSILKADTTITEEMIRETEEAHKPNFLQEQNLTKTHYALDADQLEEIFPDLVYEQEDGTKSINYIEMVPILVKTISELNGKITELNDKLVELENSTEVAKARENNTLSVSGIAADATGNALYQNTPNPFKEKTVIRFKLADNVQNASICIFDMQGKMLKNLPISSGTESVTVNGYELGAGMYLYSLIVNGQEIDTKRMILSK